MSFSLPIILKETILSGIADHNLQLIASLGIISIVFLAIAFILDKVIRRVGIELLNQVMLRSRFIFLAALAENRIFSVISLISFAFVFDFGSSFISNKGDDIYTQSYAHIILNISYFFYFLVATLSVDRIVGTVNTYYERKFDINDEYPIYGYIKMAQFAVWCIAIILYVSFLLKKSPLTTLTGIGAVSAFFVLIFKDTFLGLVSSIQATANQIVRVGDWVNIPKFEVDGEVHNISINTIKIRNWDNTITTIPTFALTTEAIHNWQAMVNSNGRRILRAIYIDANSIMPCTAELVEYLASKYIFIEKWKSRESNLVEMTNLALFRLFINHYLSNHSLLNHEFSNLARYLAPTPTGIPLQIYAFSRAVFLQEFEETQSQIFEYIYLTLPDFGLRFYQSSSAAKPI